MYYFYAKVTQGQLISLLHRGSPLFEVAHFSEGPLIEVLLYIVFENEKKLSTGDGLYTNKMLCNLCTAVLLIFVSGDLHLILL